MCSVGCGSTFLVISTYIHVHMLIVSSQKMGDFYSKDKGHFSHVPGIVPNKRYIHSYVGIYTIWRFPKMGLPPVLIHFNGIFSIIDHPAIGGISIHGYPPYLCIKHYQPLLITIYPIESSYIYIYLDR